MDNALKCFDHLDRMHLSYRFGLWFVNGYF